MEILVNLMRIKMQVYKERPPSHWGFGAPVRGVPCIGVREDTCRPRWGYWGLRHWSACECFYTLYLQSIFHLWKADFVKTGNAIKKIYLVF